MKITHRLYDTGDLLALLNMKPRYSDMLEFEGATGLPYHEALRYSIEYSSSAYVIEKENYIVGLWGYAGVAENICIPWLLQSDDMLKEKRDRIAFLRESALVIEALSVNYHYLFNYVSCFNEEAQEWLQWLGFTIRKESPVTLNTDEPFYLFEKGTNQCVSKLPQ